MVLQRDGGWPVRAMRCVPRGVEALHGHARPSYHRWITGASVMASTTHPRACLGTLPTASRRVCSRWLHGAAARWWMASTSDALRATRCGGAPWPRPTAVPSVDHGCKRDGVNHPPTCTPWHAADGLSMCVSSLAAWCCSAMVDGQYERCAACHAVWRRSMATPDRRTIGGSRVHA